MTTSTIRNLSAYRIALFGYGMKGWPIAVKRCRMASYRLLH